MLRSLADDLTLSYSDFLIKRNLRLISERYDPQNFGDSIAEVQNNIMVMRFIRDRGEVFLSIASTLEPSTLLQAEWLAQILHIAPTGIGFSLKNCVDFVDDNYNSITESIGHASLVDTKLQVAEIVRQNELKWLS